MTHAATGRCTCGEVRFALTDRPLYTHCCHCTSCQRETGSAFVLNALIERKRVEVLAGVPQDTLTPSDSGNGQIITRCKTCHVAVWSVYSGFGPRFLFVRVGTMDESSAFPPDVHIYTCSKLPWVVLPEGVQSFDRFYRRSEVWPEESQARREAALAGT
ncbi:GFA family protein [Silicimonas algicola]|uniref:CENP-V/GFA domain-containing protein n=1 Tax=Silicimonas algicola TaxID=1826607 RepID=A0A316G5S4_9RHOB|nr:GFA family protein [Silicimonas algicola]AZQ66790.1 GFA family protein [Silicimonas algicola]PWK55306.1 hypothetical protein C8D95_108186 [Silicimonas algicola]